MSSNSEIKCDLCGYKFKTFSRIETHYHDYEPEYETHYYPQQEEKAHLVRNYICDDCYNKIGDIVRRLFINKGESYNKELETRKLEAYNKYELEIVKLEEENDKVNEITNKIKATKEVLEFDDQLVKDLKNNFPYTSNATYYLDSAIDIEKRTKQNMEKVWEWADTYNIEI